MTFESVTIPLKDGRSAKLRPPRPEDAAGLLDYLRTATAETEFLLRTAEEAATMTEKGEVAWIDLMLHSADSMLIICDVDGEIAGCSQIDFNNRFRTRHRASIGIGLKSKFWNLGIGSAMFRMMEEEARRRPYVLQMELDFIEGNSRARALYEKMGFRITGYKVDALRISSGLVHEYAMQKKL